MSLRHWLKIVTAISILTALSACAQLQKDSDDFRLRWSDLSEQKFTQADAEAEVRFGREVAARFLANINGVDNARLQTYVNTLGQYVAQYSGRDDVDYLFWVVDSEQVNAYAMPGGYIFVTSAALSLMENEAELAGVLAHEIAHVTQRHIVKALDIKGIGSGAGLSQLTSGGNDAFRIALDQASAQAIALLTETGLQHNDEYEADAVGTIIMVQAGYDPGAYYRYLSRLAANRSVNQSELSKTHPRMDDRLVELANVQKNNGLQNLNYAVMETRFKNNVP